MIDICYQYSLKWRYKINAKKTQVMVFGESTRIYNRLKRLRHFKLGLSTITETDNYKHVGIILNKSLGMNNIVENACQRGRSAFMSVVGFGGRADGLNPLTFAKVYRQVVLPTALYGSELWCNLTSTQVVELERMQRFCLKVAQGLKQTTRSDMCSSLLAMPRIKAVIDKSVLLFFHRLNSLPEGAMSRRVFIFRLNQTLHGRIRPGSVVHNMCNLLHQYGLSHIVDQWNNDRTLPSKAAWKNMVINSVVDSERNAYHQRVMNDPDFRCFVKVHPDCFCPSAAWMAAKEIPNSLDLFRFVVELTVRPMPPDDSCQNLCELCGMFFFHSTMEHRVCICSRFNEVREQFWNFITDNFPIELQRYLNLLSDDELVTTLLGAPVNCDELQMIDAMNYVFLYRCAVFLYQIR